MFKTKSVLLVLCLLVIACDASDKPKKPDNLITKDKMVEVLYDLYIINAAKGVNKKLLESNGFIPETYVLTKHKIDSMQFVESNRYYAFDPDMYEAMIDDLKARLEKQKVEVEKLEKIEDELAKVKRDSINKIKRKVKDSTRKLPKNVVKKVLDTEIAD